MQLNRIGFYPVCAKDYLEPPRLLKGWVDHLVFCDTQCMPQSSRDLTEMRKTIMDESLASMSIIIGDALAAMQLLKPVDLFFLRRDSDGEGGSMLKPLRPDRLPLVLRMIKPDVLLVTDWNNGQGWFDDFSKGRRNPYRVGDREIQLSGQQPWREHGLLSFIVK